MTVPLEGKDSKTVISEMVIAGNIISRGGIFLLLVLFGITKDLFLQSPICQRMFVRLQLIKKFSCPFTKV